MARVAAIVALFIGLVAVMVLVPDYLAREDGAGDISSLPACRALAGPCEAQSGNDTVRVSLKRIGERAGEPELHLTLYHNSVQSAPVAVLKGDSMYMGEYPLPLRTTAEPGRYETVFTPPFCTIEPDMTWRIELRADGERLSLPFRVLFDAHGRS